MVFEDFFDCLRNVMPYIFLLLVFSPLIKSEKSFSFSINRMVQYDMNGVQYGSRSQFINQELKSSQSSEYSFRNTILAKIQDLTGDKLRDLKQKVGSLVFLLPKSFSELTDQEKENVYDVEQVLLADEISIPVYFTKFSEEVSELINEISRNPNTQNTANVFNQINANGYFAYTNTGPSNTPKKDSKIHVLQGELMPFKQSGDSPCIIITTHFKNLALISGTSAPNFDTTIFLALMDLLSKLYTQMLTASKYRIIFILHESGPLLNFHALKTLNTEESNIQNVEFALCLDSVVEALNSDVNIHVSKPIAAGPVAKFYEILEKKSLKHKKKVETIHKKISLKDSFQKWAHEIFSLKRMTAFTVSGLKSHTDPLRNSVFTEHSSSSPILEETMANELHPDMQKNIENNLEILLESLASYIWQLGDENDSIFTDQLSATIKPYIAPRSMSKSNNIKSTFEKFLKNVKASYDIPDARDPDFMFYDESDDTKLNVYNVKPALFDIFLSFLIAIYLCGVYLIIINFSKLFDFLCNSTTHVTVNGGVHQKTKIN